MANRNTYCNVLVDGLHKTYRYIFKGDVKDIEVGTNVIVPYGVDQSLTPGTITGIETYEEGKAPFSVENIREIFSIDGFIKPSSQSGVSE